MLFENLKNLRKAKGLSQEELAQKLNVVRQTISKWEKGTSVPDSEMLIKIAEELDTSVNILLGETVTPDESAELRAIAAKLEILNEQFSKRNEHRRKVWRIVFITLGTAAILLFIMGFDTMLRLQGHIDALVSFPVQEGVIGGADGPTSIIITRNPSYGRIFIGAAIASVIAAIGIYRTKKN
ncbi:MAG: helix-turn-helix transcriptional regulator [Clostridia bacterium]|nr:helix-turn-helix transcriptional regulator [Clostridia bacterium]